jgi:4'-phosphopantetheinyl transferase EntD
LTARWLGFEDAHIVFDVDPGDKIATGTFVSKILIDGQALSGPPLTALRGRWSVERGLVIAAIVL